LDDEQGTYRLKDQQSKSLPANKSGEKSTGGHMNASKTGRITILVAAVAIASLTVISPLAQAQTITMRITIPFEFYAGSTVLPAGTYDVWRSATGDAVTITDRKGHTAFVVTNGNQRRGGSESSEMVFNGYDTKYFLGEIRWSGYPVARSLPKTKLEQQLAQNSLGPRTLSVSNKPVTAPTNQ
jgi:hypothetical protein